MTTAVVIFLACALVATLYVWWFRPASTRLDGLVADTLADIDIDAWERDMAPSQSPLFDDDGWLR